MNVSGYRFASSYEIYDGHFDQMKNKDELVGGHSAGRVVGHPLSRPVIIVAAPRSGSTLLFDLLSHAREFWTVGGESHAVFESIPALRPKVDGDASNRLTYADASPEIGNLLVSNFIARLRDRWDVPYEKMRIPNVRMLEKTPKNSLRIPFLDAIFPDAMFIYLYRDARENLSSIMEAWRSGRFVTYRDLPGWDGEWSLLLPPGWQRLRGEPLERIAAFQWEAANRFILDDLENVASDRWTCISYSDLVSNPRRELQKLCKFSGVTFDELLDTTVSQQLPLSRYTLTSPRPDKWRKNEKEISTVLPLVEALTQRIEEVASRRRAEDGFAGD